jgi:DNA-binding protein
MTFKRTNIFIKLKNFTIAVFKHIADGFAKTSIETKGRRLSKCLDCPHSKNEWFECRVCGCSINEKIKWKSEKCPENKWK